MGKVMTDLAIKISAQVAELNKGVNQANRKLDGFAKQNQRLATNIRNSWLKLTGIVAGSMGALKAGKKILESTQITGDALHNSVKGLEGGFERFSEKLATLDFTNFFRDITNATVASKDFAVALDELGDVERALSVQKAENRLKIEELKLEVEKYKYTNPEKAKEAVQEIIRVSEEEIDKAIKASEQKMNALQQKYMQTYGITEEQFSMIEDFVRNYDTLTEAELGTIKKINEAKTELANATQKITGRNDYGGETISTKKYNEIKASIVQMNAGLSESAKKWLELDPVLQNLVDEERDFIAQIMIEAAERERAGVRFIKQAETYNNLLDTQIKKTKTLAELRVAGSDEVPGKLESITPQIDVPEINTELASVEGSLDRIQTKWKDLNSTMKKTNDISSEMGYAFQTVGAQLTTTLIEGENGWKDFAKVALDSIMSILSGLLAQAIIGLYANEASKEGVYGLLIASAAAGGLYAAYDSIIGSIDFADGGIVYGETLARVAEYSGASSNPEVIAPLNKLQGILGNTSIGEVRFEIEGNKLVGILEKKNIRKKVY